MKDKPKVALANNKTWTDVFGHAIDGCFYAFKTQKNFKVHAFASLVMLVLGILLDISSLEWALIVLLITIGFCMEMINTAFEKTVDLVTEDFNEKAKVAKDVAAGIMLIASIGCAIGGILVLGPHFLDLFQIR